MEGRFVFLHGLRTGDRGLIRELNTLIILDCIRRESPVARSEIARLTGVSRSTISNIVSFLMNKRLVEPVGAGHSTGGRPPQMLAFNPERYGAIGLKLQPGGVVGCRTDLDGSITARASSAISGRSVTEALQAMDHVLNTLTSTYGKDRLLGVGLALPGLVDSSRGISISPHFFDWGHFPLRELLEARWDLPVWVENDARAGSLGEKWTHPTEKPTFLFVTVGIGIGAGIVLSGKVMDGDLVGAGHLGHTKVETEGRPCHCGLAGCLETVAGDEALIRFAKQYHMATRGNDIGAEDVFHAAKSGDPGALQAVEKVAGYLGQAIGNAIKLLGIRRVVIGGETGVLGGTFFTDIIETHVKYNVFSDTRDDVEVVLSGLGNDVWLVGAASLVLESVFSPPIYGEPNVMLEKVVSSP